MAIFSSNRLQTVYWQNATFLNAPGTVTPAPSTTGGTLATGTYYYKVTAINASGETQASPEATAAVTGPTGSVVLTWSAITGATSYKIYRGTVAGAENVYYTSAGATYTDTGAASSAGSPPSTNTTTSALRTVQNSSGVWTNTGTKKLRFTSFTMTPIRPVVDINYKTGNSSQPVGITGRASATFSGSLPLILSGAAGTVPDVDPILAHIFGQAGAVVASTSVTYSLSDSIITSCAFWYDKNNLATPSNMFLLGAIIKTWKLSFNGPFPMLQIDGEAVYAVDQTYFASFSGSDVIVKGGLTSYPVEPSVATTGNAQAGFGGTLTLDSNSMTPRGNLEITGTTGLEFATDGYPDAYPYAVVRGLRRISFSNLTFLNDDSTGIVNLKQKSESKAAITGTLVLGTTAGSICTVTLNNLQLTKNNFSENGTFLDVNFQNSPAHASNTTVTDDCTLALT